MNNIKFSKGGIIPKFDKKRKFKRIIKDDFGRPILVYVNTEDILQYVREEIRANAKRVMYNSLKVDPDKTIINLTETHSGAIASKAGESLRKALIGVA